MKTISYLSALAVGLSMVACSDYHEPNPSTPSTPGDNTAINAEGVTVTPTPTISDAEGNLNVIDLEGYIRMNAPIQVAAITTDAEEFNQAFTNFRVVSEVSATPSFATTAVMEEATYENGIVSFNAQELEDAYQSIIGKNPAERVIYTRYAIYASNGLTGNIRLGGDNFWYGPVEMLVLPVDLGIVIEEAYYIVGSFNGWSPEADKLIPFNHSDKSAFDDPNFSVILEVTQDMVNNFNGGWWKIIPLSAINAADNSFNWDLAWGPEADGDSNPSGTLVNENAQAAVIPAVGTYQLSINMLDCTYEWKLAYPFLYTPGSSNGWSQTASQLLPTNNYENYAGFLSLKDGCEFKCCGAPNWDDATTYGHADEEGVLTSPGRDNFKGLDGEGLYWMNVNISAMSYFGPVKIESLGLIGSFNSWSAQEPLTPSADYLTWTGTLKMPSNGELKVRGNDNWDINLGNLGNNDSADTDALYFNGGNIQVEAGTYAVELDLSKIPYSMTLTPAN